MKKKTFFVVAIFTFLFVNHLAAYTWHFYNYSPYVVHYKLDIVSGRDAQNDLGSGQSISKGVLGYLIRKVEASFYVGGNKITLEAKHGGAGLGWDGKHVVFGVYPKIATGSTGQIEGFYPFIMVGNNKPIMSKTMIPAPKMHMQTVTTFAGPDENTPGLPGQ
ncbi:hypothetical protein GF322_04015 [Candidatus Dependentiae bacterium]|nr:hypothetical protein [Candidatus Dependentiae bacterium]